MTAIWIPDSLYRFAPWLYFVFALVMIMVSSASLIGFVELLAGLSSLIWGGWIVSQRFLSQRLGW